MVSFLKGFGYLILLLWSGVDVQAGENNRPRLGGEPVCADELAFYEAQLRTEVASRLMLEHGLQMADTFWTTPIDGVTPLEVLEAETLSAIEHARAVQQRAVEAGILDEAKTYRQLVEAFHAENQRRKELKEGGEVFYGPVRFRQEVWFDVWFEQLAKALEKAAVARHPGAPDA